jgi:hypothetical protein
VVDGHLEIENHITIPLNSKEEVKCAQMLAENWSPLKKQKFNSEESEACDSEFE